MKQYHDFLKHILNHGKPKSDRTGTGTISLFGYQMRFDLQEGFPLVTTKKVHFKSIVHELIWFLSGSTNIKYLQDNKVRIWDEWADDKGNLGPVYGRQWRNQNGIDQIQAAINLIKSNPDSRRIIVNAWNAYDLPDMALAPCHTMFQFYVQDNKLSCQLYQRSADAFLGVPFNIASYALLTQMIAQVTNLGLGDFVHTIGDAHIYTNHLDQVKLQLTREPYNLPHVQLNKEIKHIDNFRFDDVYLIDYKSHSKIKGSVAV